MILYILCQGVAQLVARSVRDAEVVGSSPITLTTMNKKPLLLGAVIFNLSFNVRIVQ